MSAQFPAYQRMSTHDSKDQVEYNLRMAYRIFGVIDPNECKIVDFVARPDWSTYRLEWTTYLGWKCYMYMTGCIASDPKYELLPLPDSDNGWGEIPED